MKGLSAKIIPVILLTLTLNAPSLAENTSKIVSEIEKLYSTIRDYKAKFTQEVIYTSLGKTQHDTGMVFFKKPGKMRWEYDPPKSQVIVIDGRNIWFYMPNEKQVLTEYLSKAFSSKTPVSLLSGAEKLSRYFRVRKTEDFKNLAHGITLELIPLEKIPDTKKVVIAVDEKRFIITDTFVVDKFDNVNHIILSDIKTNIGLPDELFTFTPPPGVEIIRPSDVMEKRR